MRPGSRGFTLLEMLVVLAIAALLASIALPNLGRMLASLESAGQRKALITQIEGLGFRAFSEAKPYVLASVPADPATASPPAAPLEVPPGWRLRVPRPIEYSFNGHCSGGTLTLVAPDGQEQSFALRAPLCRVESQG